MPRFDIDGSCLPWVWRSGAKSGISSVVTLVVWRVGFPGHVATAAKGQARLVRQGVPAERVAPEAIETLPKTPRKRRPGYWPG